MAPGEWTFLLDPGWMPAGPGRQPPVAAVVGGWFVPGDGGVSLFRPNPGYRPSRPGLPTDPVDEALHRLVFGGGDGEELLTALPEVLFGLAVTANSAPVVAPAPDGVPSMLVVTAPVHRDRVRSPGWRRATIAELAGTLPSEGVDVLLNPGAPASIRLTAGAIREVGAPGPGAVVTVRPDDSDFWADDVFSAPAPGQGG
ncbi:type VII secretion system-associated protein [Amycolatopsis sp. PS_44_ISF1]|uniref:type VII secretion system-associated protein n=1 Tax=Amycolatopsis sp. PS_44_ISF1 TaxID=2974917 RepID=UPI0028E02CAC|nr:type VII secretion system-associated protein [Amycolatopsis sp. PS_44_ISF1]MDT8912082.1 type VII secretion system-associated protein [Amycolatopsis sp. PS_44_ISF1]